jgi:threonylcarbamoyladenosine tRNA methylthiotransferase MtaB
MLSFSIQTLGCKLNQLESEAIAEAFAHEGFRILDAGTADLTVINTCTVTSKAEQKARRIIRKALKENPAEGAPHACVIVTGCYAQLDRENIQSLEKDSRAALAVSPTPSSRNTEGPETAGPQRRLFVNAGDSKSRLLDLPRFIRDAPPAELGRLLNEWFSGASAKQEQGPGVDVFRFNVQDFSFHSRAFLKIQDGCDNACSYCRVSLARGPSVSLDAGTALERLKALETRGYAEAVLTGVNLNQYRQSGKDLGLLLEYLIAGTERIRLRLSSLEPEGFTGSLPRALGHERIRPHFHLSAQSGSGAVLERMRRPYSPDAVEQAVCRLRELREDPFLACDIITGFPGETPGDFEQTLELCRSLDFAWIHAFPYSRRPGTEAWQFRQTVPEREAVTRVESLLGLARRGRAAYIGRWRGREVEAVVQGNSPRSGITSALTENYLRIALPWDESQTAAGSLIRCRVGEPFGAEDPHFDAWGEWNQEGT